MNASKPWSPTSFLKTRRFSNADIRPEALLLYEKPLQTISMNEIHGPSKLHRVTRRLLRYGIKPIFHQARTGGLYVTRARGTEAEHRDCGRPPPDPVCAAVFDRREA